MYSGVNTLARSPLHDTRRKYGYCRDSIGKEVASAQSRRRIAMPRTKSRVVASSAATPGETNAYSCRELVLSRGSRTGSDQKGSPEEQSQPVRQVWAAPDRPPERALVGGSNPPEPRLSLAAMKRKARWSRSVRLGLVAALSTMRRRLDQVGCCSWLRAERNAQHLPAHRYCAADALLSPRLTAR